MIYVGTKLVEPSTASKNLMVYVGNKLVSKHQTCSKRGASSASPIPSFDTSYEFICRVNSLGGYTRTIKITTTGVYICENYLNSSSANEVWQQVGTLNITGDLKFVHEWGSLNVSSNGRILVCSADSSNTYLYTIKFSWTNSVNISTISITSSLLATINIPLNKCRIVSWDTWNGVLTGENGNYTYIYKLTLSGATQKFAINEKSYSSSKINVAYLTSSVFRYFYATVSNNKCYLNMIECEVEDEDLISYTTKTIDQLYDAQYISPAYLFTRNAHEHYLYLVGGYKSYGITEQRLTTIRRLRLDGPFEGTLPVQTIVCNLDETVVNGFVIPNPTTGYVFELFITKVNGIAEGSSVHTTHTEYIRYNITLNGF